MPITSVKYFNPKQISGCSLWLDSADPAATGGGVNVSTWLDKSGNGNTATNQGSAGTITSTAAGLVFNGSGYMYIPGIAGSLVNKPFVIFIVETLNTTSGATILGDDSSANYGTDNVLHILYRNTSDLAMGFFSDDLEDTVISGTGNKRLWAFYLPLASNRVTRRNGAVDVTHGNYNRLNYFTTPSIGRSFGGYLYVGTISEIIIYPSDIGLTAIQQVEGYLAQKWGVTLATGHPGLTQTFYGRQNLNKLVLLKTPYYQKFLPTSIAGCGLWLDAADSSTITLSSSSVTQWNDKSGNGRNYTTWGTAPIYTSADGGSVTFSYGQGLQNSSTWSGNGAGVDIFVVSTPWSYTQYYDWRTLFRGYTAGHRVIILYNGTTFGYYANNGGGLFQYGSLTLDNTKTLIYVKTDSSFVTSAAFNGNVTLSTAGSTQDSDTNPFYYLGCYQGGPSQPWGTINEILIFSNLGASQRQLVESYLAQKWNLVSSMPASGHIQNTFPAGSPTAIQPLVASIKPTLTSYNLRQVAGSTALSYLPMTQNATDYGGTPQTVTTNGTVTYTAIAGKLCAYFSNSFSNYLSIPYTPQTQLTLCFWLYCIDAGSYTAVTITNGSLNPTLQVDLATGSSTSTTIYTAMPNQWANQPSGNYGGPGQWAHFAITVNYSTYFEQLYINGTSAATATGSGSPSISQTNIWLGRSGDNGRAYYGYIRQFCLFSSVLTQTQIQAVRTFTS